jgi:cold shock CspA family protein
MDREKRPDDVARAAAGVPPEPLGTRARTIGTVKWWRGEKGYGAIASAATAPWDIWCHFSNVEQAQFYTLPSGERVRVTRDDDGRIFLPSGEQLVSGYVQGEGFVELRPGESVEVVYDRANQESFRYVARTVRRLNATSS